MRAEDWPRPLIERYLAAYNAFDVPGILAPLHPNVTFENVVVGEVTATATGLAEFRALAERAVALFTSRRQTIRQCVAEAQGARVENRVRGRPRRTSDRRSAPEIRFASRGGRRFRCRTGRSSGSSMRAEGRTAPRALPNVSLQQTGDSDEEAVVAVRLARTVRHLHLPSDHVARR
jgi:hypothetical protein